MRSVSSATCTLVEPVSCSPAPNWAAISRLRSVVIAVIGGHTVAERCGRRTSSQSDLARLRDVAMHLLDQRLRRVKAPLATQTLDEAQLQRLAVDVAVEVQQVGLDQLPATGFEG